MMLNIASAYNDQTLSGNVYVTSNSEKHGLHSAAMFHPPKIDYNEKKRLCSVINSHHLRSNENLHTTRSHNRFLLYSVLYEIIKLIRFVYNGSST